MVTVKKEALTTLVFTNIKLKKKNARLPSSFFSLFSALMSERKLSRLSSFSVCSFLFFPSRRIFRRMSECLLFVETRLESNSS